MSGVLHIVGLGPGGPEHRTPAATDAVRGADVVVGYGPYVDQCADLVTGDVVRAGMGEEAARADEALRLAAAGRTVALVSSGDAGVYGMAARTLAAAAALPEDGRPRVEVVPGLTAALAAAARLGAPLCDDFATLSLSDLHVPWDRVQRRLAAVAASGIAIALYNPASRTRTFDPALAVLREWRPDATPCALVRDVARPAESITATTLGALDPEAVDMRTIVLVAGEDAVTAGPWLVALRTEGTVPPVRVAGAGGPEGPVHPVLPKPQNACNPAASETGGSDPSVSGRTEGTVPPVREVPGCP